jgi:hypothetical protein
MNQRTAIVVLAGSLTAPVLLGLATGREPGLGDLRHLPVARSAHFAVAHTLEPAAATDLSQLLEVLYSRYHEACRAAGFQPRPPTAPLPWLCIDDPVAYARYADQLPGGLPADSDSFYSACSNTVALLYGAPDESGKTTAGKALVGSETWRISHELAHQMCFNTGLQARGVLYPVWVSEGLAANFETHFPVAGGFAGSNPSRQRRLVAAYRQGRLRPLTRMVELIAPPPEGEACLDVYAQAWGLVQFLFQRDPSAFRCYLYTLALRPSGKRPAAALQAEFESAFGPTAELQQAWEGYLAKAAGATG